MKIPKVGDKLTQKHINEMFRILGENAKLKKIEKWAFSDGPYGKEETLREELLAQGFGTAQYEVIEILKGDK